MTVTFNRDATPLLEEVLSDPALGPAARHVLEAIIIGASFSGDVPALIDLISRAIFSPHLLETETFEAIDERGGLYRDIELVGRMAYGRHILASVEAHLATEWNSAASTSALKTLSGRVLRVVTVPKINRADAKIYREGVWRELHPGDFDAPRPLRTNTATPTAAPTTTTLSSSASTCC